MNGILGLSEIMLRNDIEDRERDHVKLIKSSAQGLLAVIDDIIEYSRIEAGDLSIVKESFNLQQVAGEVTDLFRVTAADKNLQLDLNLDDGLPALLEGDPSRLRQVLVNLISNAIKFTHTGGVKIRFSISGNKELNTRIRCEIEDTGIGIEPKIIESLFLPFSQADESKTRKFGGSGLGLPISKQAVEAQAGSIGVVSEMGLGSIFWFEIPYIEGSIDERELESPPEEGPVRRHDVRVLLAEDNEINQIVAVRQLEELGLTVDVAWNGREVLKALKKNQYSLVLMDCQMPELDGIEATRLIRKRGYTESDLPIIALTTHVFDEDRKRCFEAGMNDFLSKPLSLLELRNTMEKWLEKDSFSL
jgi:CheY-like chemotaxis protein